MKRIYLAAGALLALAVFLTIDNAVARDGLMLAAPATQFLGFDDGQAYRRVRKDLPAFENVVATGVAQCKITRRAGSLAGVVLYMSGTTFNETYITDIRLKLGGSRTIWGPISGADLRKLNAFKGHYDGNRQHLWIGFGPLIRGKSYGGQYVGAIDMTTLPQGQLTLEVTISGATAPALSGKACWVPAGSGTVIEKLVKINYSTSGTGRKVLPIDQDTFKGGRIRNIYGVFTGTSWEQGTATSAAWSGNTGNGAMGTVTSTAGAMVGTHRIAIVEPGTNVGTFLHFIPDNGSPDAQRLNSKSGVVASAYASGGLSFTLADGATDFVSGDGFDITVGENTNGNITRLELLKDGEPLWDMYDYESRQHQRQFGYKPQSLLTAMTFEMDGWPDGAIKTADANHLETAATFTAADTLTLYAEVLSPVTENIN